MDSRNYDECFYVSPLELNPSQTVLNSEGQSFHFFRTPLSKNYFVIIMSVIWSKNSIIGEVNSKQIIWYSNYVEYLKMYSTFFSTKFVTVMKKGWIIEYLWSNKKRIIFSTIRCQDVCNLILLLGWYPRWSHNTWDIQIELIQKIVFKYIDFLNF